MDELEEIRERVENWKNGELTEKELRDELIETIRTQLRIYNMTELSELTGIKRTTLYYMLYGRSGKNRQSAA